MKTSKLLSVYVCSCHVFEENVAPVFSQHAKQGDRNSVGKTIHRRVCPKVSGLAAWSENCKWYGSLPLGAVVSLFCESV